MLPAFLGLGVPKAGTTWLHHLLAGHPEVWMPVRRKEVRFFTTHYDEGLDWYAGFFPAGEEAARYGAVGEITPEYFHWQQGRCAERIAGVPSIRKFILSLRNPVDRAFSAYGHRVRNYNYRGTFEDFMAERPHEIACGHYARHLDVYLRRFEREQFLILLFENLFDDVEATKRRLAAFLEVDSARFPAEAGQEAMNRTYIPRFRGAFALAQKGLRALRRRELGGALGFIHRSGIGPLTKRLMGRRSKEDALPPMRPETRARLIRRYADDVRRLEALAGLDLSAWKQDLGLAPH